jgi:ribonuclease BN (tRNA processing enzyme)
MTSALRRACFVAFAVIVGLPPSYVGAEATQSGCGSSGDVALQILGSGGPELASGRASTSYLVWHEGRARVLADLGSGALLRFGQSGAQLDDIELIALSHLHVDHAADLPALVKSGYFSARTASLRVAGPGAGGNFPGLVEWLDALFMARSGSFRYLSGALDGSDGQFRLVPTEIPTMPKRVSAVVDLPDLRIDALPVAHGTVPALAYRIRVGGRVIVFGGDQTGQSERFWEFTRSADLLVAHLAIPEQAGAAARALHAPPSRIGAGAARSEVRHLVLSHFMTRSEATLEANVEVVRRDYGGPLTLADDLLCIGLPVRETRTGASE